MVTNRIVTSYHYQKELKASGVFRPIDVVSLTLFSISSSVQDRICALEKSYALYPAS